MLCYKHSNDDQPVNLTAEFLNETVPQFRGKFDVFLIDFTFSLNYQMSRASFNVNSDPEDSLRSLRFVLNREIGSNQLVLRIPNYESSTQEGFDSLFALGPKGHRTNYR
ncbi:MAG: hypothetical protein ACJARX_001058 [Psychroserpens sp.]